MRLLENTRDLLDEKIADTLLAIHNNEPRLAIAGITIFRTIKNIFAFHKKAFIRYYQINKVAHEAVDLVIEPRADGTRVPLSHGHADIVGMFCATISQQEGVYHLSLQGFKPESFIVLRAQLESIFNFLYVIDPGDDYDEVLKRVSDYRDWVKIRMKRNLEKSLAFDACVEQKLYSEDYIRAVNENFSSVKDRLGESKTKIIMEKQHNFLDSRERFALAEKLNIKELYHHVYAESSASVHGADFGDRVAFTTIDGSEYVEYTLRHERPGEYAVLISNMLQWRAAKSFAHFFNIQENIVPKLNKAMGL